MSKLEGPLKQKYEASKEDEVEGHLFRSHLLVQMDLMQIESLHACTLAMPFYLGHSSIKVTTKSVKNENKKIVIQYAQN